MHTVFPRIIKWNAARYEREFNLGLTVSMLREEYKEWLEAKTPVAKLDALCDIIYVALGAIWKANINEGDLFEAEKQAAYVLNNLIEANELWPAYFIGTYLDVMQYDNDYPLVNSLQLIISTAMAEMTGFGLSHEQCIQALHIVCDSNDSKTIHKVDSHIKANGMDKGPYYKAPETKLEKLLEEARGKLN